MNFYLHKAKIISTLVFSFNLMTSVYGTINAYGDFPQDLCFEEPCGNCGKFAFEADFLILRPYEKESDPCAFNDVVNTVDSEGNVLTAIEIVIKAAPVNGDLPFVSVQNMLTIATGNTGSHGCTLIQKSAPGMRIQENGISILIL